MKLYHWLDKHFYLRGLAIFLVSATIFLLINLFTRSIGWSLSIYAITMGVGIALCYLIKRRKW